MVIFDAHCDTVQKITDLGGELAKNSFHIDLERLCDTSGRVQMFAAFVDRENDILTPFLRCEQLIEKYFYEISKNPEHISHCKNREEIENALEQGKAAALLSIEGGEAVEGRIEKLRYFYELGVRCMTLTWNYDNEISGGIGENQTGLTDFGKKVVSEMNSLGMLIDVSHISEKGFWDVLENSKSPIAATHSNARKICPHKRNLDDEQINAIIKKEGCIGINLYSDFLSEGTCSTKDVLKHVEHILALGGENNLGLGSDFDGMDKLPEGINGTEDLGLIFEEMQKIGYADSLIKKISSGNFLNLFEKILI